LPPEKLIAKKTMNKTNVFRFKTLRNGFLPGSLTTTVLEEAWFERGLLITLRDLAVVVPLALFGENFLQRFFRLSYSGATVIPTVTQQGNQIPVFGFIRDSLSRFKTSHETLPAAG